jgi:hypothetical protein
VCQGAGEWSRLVQANGTSQAEQSHAGDGKQAPLVPRPACFPRLTRPVSRPKEKKERFVRLRDVEAFKSSMTGLLDGGQAGLAQVVRVWRALAAGAVASVAGHGVPGVETHHPVQVVAQRLARALGLVRRAGPGPGQRADRAVVVCAVSGLKRRRHGAGLWRPGRE